MHAPLCTDRCLVMELIEGQPLLEAAGLDTGARHDAMAALVLAFGVQVRGRVWGMQALLCARAPHPSQVLLVGKPPHDLLRQRAQEAQMPA